MFSWLEPDVDHALELAARQAATANEGSVRIAHLRLALKASDEAMCSPAHVPPHADDAADSPDGMPSHLGDCLPLTPMLIQVLEWAILRACAEQSRQVTHAHVRFGLDQLTEDMTDEIAVPLPAAWPKPVRATCRAIRAMPDFDLRFLRYRQMKVELYMECQHRVSASTTPAQGSDAWFPRASVAYDLTEGDLLDYYISAFRQYFWHSGKLVKRMLGPALMISILGGAAILESTRGGLRCWSDLSGPLILVCLGPLYAVLYYIHSRRKHVRYVEPLVRAHVGRYTLQVADAGIAFSREGGNHSFQWMWQFVPGLTAEKGQLVLRLASGGVVVVPSRSFKDQQCLFAWLQQFSMCSGRQVDCPRCGYDLYGTTSGRCPECGYPQA